MLSNYANYEKRRQQDYVKNDGNGLTTFMSFAAFSLLVISLGLSPTFVLLLPLSAFAVALLASNPNHFGLGFSVLIIISLSRHYSTASIPELVLIVRIAVISLFGITFLKNIREPSEYRAPLPFFALFLLVAAVSSYYHSIYVEISELKLLFAGLFFLGLLKSARGTDGFPAALFGIISAIAILSAAFFFIYPTVGYAFVLDPNVGPGLIGRFSGIMSHPQLLAILLGVNLPLLLYAYLTSKGATWALAVAAIAATIMLTSVSSSRAGLLTVAVGFASLLYLMRNSPSPLTRSRLKQAWGMSILAVLLGLATCFEEIQIFIFKTSDFGGGINLSGRDEIITASWNGFLANPIFGNGFQVPSEYTEYGAASFGMDSDATSVEKCFFITMLLEEVGIVGAFLFLSFVGLLFKRWNQKGSYVSIAAMLAFLTANIGEACILSPSSIGGLCWLSIFAAHNLVHVQPGRPSPR